MRAPASQAILLRVIAVLLGLGLTIALLLLVEAGFLVFAGPADDPATWLSLEAEGTALSAVEFHRERLRLHRPDRDLFWSTRPNIDIVFRGVRVRTNSLGLRDDEVPEEKSKGELRILVLGESTAFGDLVEQDQTFAEVLQRELAQRTPACRVSVINAGVTGYSLFQSTRYLELRGRALEPDVVMIYHGFNDFLPTTFAAERTGVPMAEAGLTDREMAEARARFPASLDLLLYYNSTAYRWMRTLNRPSAGDAPEYRVSSRPRVPEDDRRALLEQMRRLTEGEGARLVVLVPVYRDFDQHRTTLLDFGRATGTPVVDLEPAVAAAGGRRPQLFFPDALHPRPFLHRAIADRVLAGLLEAARGETLPQVARCLDVAESRVDPNRGRTGRRRNPARRGDRQG
jgi:lysophospholipase L1-like esterase